LWAHSLSVVDVGEQKRIELDAQLSVLKDPSSRMTIDQVAGKEGGVSVAAGEPEGADAGLYP
jgi:hypothetical protein